MCITEYDEARTFAEQREEGIEIGIEIGSIKMLSSLVKGGVLTVEQAATAANVSVSEFEMKMKAL